MMWGIYDPHHAFADDRNIDYAHIFVYWQALNQPKFKEDLPVVRQQLRDAQERHRGMIITVEPYTKAINWRDGSDHLFSDITGGHFDHEIEMICTEVGKFRGPALIRWGHEMERSSSRYPWAGGDPAGYKRAFRYFVKQCRSYAPQAGFVWSPIGESNLAAYYPGSAYVDVVGVSLYGFQRMEKFRYGHARDFVESFGERYQRVAHFGKPVIIAELGVTGDQEYRSNWFANMFQTIAGGTAFPELRGIVYFNDGEPCHCYGFFGDPDWRIPAGWFQEARQETAQVQTVACARDPSGAPLSPAGLLQAADRKPEAGGAADLRPSAERTLSC
jgi:beta-mannanase